MKIIIIIAIIFIIYKVISNKKQSSPPAPTASYGGNSSLAKTFLDRSNHMPIKDCQSYYETLRECYEKFGNTMFDTDILISFLHGYSVDAYMGLTIGDVKRDLEKIARGEPDSNLSSPSADSLISLLTSWGKHENLMEITDLNSYYKALREYYEKYGSGMLNLDVIMRFSRTYQLDNKLQKSARDIQKDIETIANGDELPNEKLPIYKTKRWKEITKDFPDIYDAKSYLNTLEYFYLEYFKRMFDKDVINEFIRTYQIDKKFNIGYKDVIKDLKKLEKQIKADMVEERGDEWYYLTRHITENEITTINDYKSYIEVLKQYYLKYGDDMFLPAMIKDFIKQNQLDSKFNIQFDDVANDLRELRKTGNITPKRTTKHTAPLQNEQTQTTISTPPVQPQDEQKQTTSIIPPVQTQSILDTQTLFDYIKDMPIKWEYANPNLSPSKDLQQLCNTFLTDMEISKCYSRDVIMNMEYIIQKKRARTPNTEEYNKVMERNILFELYKYSYYMNFFKVLEDRKNDKVDIDNSELANLIREDCLKRFGNLENEKRKTPAIQDMLQKYKFDTQGVKMIVNDYVEPREYDYIYASLMTLTLLNIVNYVLYSELKIDNDYQPTIQIVKKYPASDFIAALDTYLASFINLALNMYTNDGKLPTRPQ